MRATQSLTHFEEGAAGEECLRLTECQSTGEVQVQVGTSSSSWKLKKLDWLCNVIFRKWRDHRQLFVPEYSGTPNCRKTRKHHDTVTAAYVLTLLPGKIFQVFQVAGEEEEREITEYIDNLFTFKISLQILINASCTSNIRVWVTIAWQFQVSMSDVLTKQ